MQSHPQSTSFETCTCILHVLQVLTVASSAAGLPWHLVHVHHVRKRVTWVPFFPSVKRHVQCVPESIHDVCCNLLCLAGGFVEVLFHDHRWLVCFMCIRTNIRYIDHPSVSNRVYEQRITPKWLCGRGVPVLLMIVNGNSWAINHAAWFGSNAGGVDISQVSVSIWCHHRVVCDH